MNARSERLPLTHALRGSVLILLAMLAPISSVYAVPPTFWTGPTTNFTQTPPGTTTGAGRDNYVAGFAFTRPPFTKPYNPITEGGPGLNSPADSEWATATPAVTNDLTQATNLTYHPFVTWALAFGTGHLNGVVNQPGVVHLKNENIYIAIKFSFWGGPQGEGFAYTRSTPAAVTPPTPTVSITSPASGAVFSAPANVTISASASVSSGAVTNVSFFNLAAPLGSATSAPFTITASNLAAGTYHLKATATAAGVSGSSAIVNISVVTPVAISNSAPTITNGEFAFSYTANPGLTYLVQTSPDLMSWSPLVTNVPAGSPVPVTDLFNFNTNRYYRVKLLPNP